MKIYSLYYYDRPFLASWLSHYCQFTCIDEILIQNQNWSRKDTLFLYDTVAGYVDHYRKKIVVLPSTFKHIEGENKRSQFYHYGQPKMRNRVIQFLQNDTWILGAMDEAIYGESYEGTERKLEEFEKYSEERAKQGKSTIGNLPLYSVRKDRIVPSGFSFQQYENPVWKHRMFRLTAPFKHGGSTAHDNSLNMLINGKWARVTTVAGFTRETDITKRYHGFNVPVSLKILHFHTLTRPSMDSAVFIRPRREEIKNLDEWPSGYFHLFSG